VLYYLADTTLTLLRRMLNREPFWRAHRTHFFQRALARDGNHAAVVRLILVGNLALAAAAVAGIWQPLPALGAGVLITIALMAALSRRSREASGDWRGFRAAVVRDGQS
jgi:hypothetical protein